MNGEELLERVEHLGRGRPAIRADCLTARRRARDGELLGYDLNVLLDPVLGVPCEDPNGEPRWVAGSAYVLFLDQDLQIPVREGCAEADVLASVLSHARENVQADVPVQVESCTRLGNARSGRVLGYAGRVLVGSVARTVFLDPDGALPLLQRVDFPV